MKLTKELQERIQELNLGEHQLQNLLLQNQAFQVELNETESAIEEVKKSGEELYKVVGSIMVKAKRQEILRELEEKQKLLNMRLKAIGNQEQAVKSKLEKLKKELDKEISQETKEK